MEQNMWTAKALEYQRNLNDYFCQDAEELRFETMSGTFFKGVHLKPYGVDPEEFGVLRSVKSLGRNRYIFPIDIDAVEVDEPLREAARMLAAGIKNYFDVDCAIKETGNTGLHIYGWVVFPWLWKDKQCREYMKGMACTAWSLMGLTDTGIDFGKNREKPYIDTCMYDAGRMIRAFSKHPKSGRYPSVLQGEYTLKEGLYQRPVMRPLVTHEVYKDGSSVSGMPTTYLDEIVVGNPKSTFSHMPKKLKKLVAYSGDPPHEHKWGLILWMRKNTNHTPEQIAKWIWDNCQWDDLNNWSTTLYHTRWTCLWSDRMYERSGKRPLPGWIYGHSM